MDELTSIVIAPTILFLIFVAPIWIIMHYRSKNRAQTSLTNDERDELERLSEAAENMRKRIDTLESILDSDSPEWRRRAASE